MMKEWATVISWQNGVAQLRCETQAGCSSCHSRSGCGSHVLNELGPKNEHLLQMNIAQELEPGQKVELGIMEDSLLRCAMLIYMTPLFGLIAGGGALQGLLKTDIYALIGAVAGGTIGFIIARFLATKMADNYEYQPVVLQIGLSPNLFRFQSE